MDDATTTRSADLRRRIHSLTGVVPLGLFVVIHLLANAAAMSGEAAYVRIARPLAFPIALLIVYLPLAFHFAYGAWLVVKKIPHGEPQPNRYLYVLQRIASIVVLAFLVFHVASTRLLRFKTGLDPVAIYTKLTEQLSGTWGGIPVASAIYVFGIAATIFHLTYGMWTFARVGSSRVDLQACKLEYSIVSPK